MSETILKPERVFACFAQVNKIPRPSKREERMIDFLLQYGQSLGLDTRRDETGNVIIRKPATPGMENRPTVVLQSHMDMVCEKNKSVDFDFDRDAIQTYVDGEWMRAKGTTLGADDGIGVAMEMAILADNTVKHGPLECVFTRDEETGLTGAEGMGPDFMTGQYLINLDSEDEGEIFVSCAGGCRTTATFHYEEKATPQNQYFVDLCIKGLTGGHSGDDIDKKRANANKLLFRFLYQELKSMPILIADVQAGGLHNAIPREARVTIAVPNGTRDLLAADWNLFAAAVREEYSVTEPTVDFVMETAEPTATVVDRSTGERLIMAVQGVTNGVFAMSQDIALVETSTNLASINMVPERKTIEINSSQRSSILSARHNVSDTFAAVFELAGAEVETGEGYPGWKPNPDSHLLKVAVAEYKRLFHKEPVVRGIHAGLECGLFSEKYPSLDMISFGPTLRGVHSPDEKLLIPTVQMVWDHLLGILENI